MPNGTIKLQDIVNLASIHADLAPLAGIGGYTNEPALSLCNDTLQELLAPANPMMGTGGFPWRFNRKVMTRLVTSQNKQDYLFAGACAFTVNGGVGIALATAGTPGCTESGTTVTVTTLEPHNFNVGDTVYMLGNTVAAYNSTLSQTPSIWQYTGGWTITAVPTSTSFTFTHASSGLGNSGAPGITDYGWLESASMVDNNNTSPLMNVKQLRACRELPNSPNVDNPRKVSIMNDDYAGTLTVRFNDVPGGTVWGADLVYQAKAPLKTNLTNTWDPFPDELSFVYRQMFLARCYRYIEDKVGPAKVAREDQKAQIAILKGLGLKDAEESEEYFAPERSFLEF